MSGTNGSDSLESFEGNGDYVEAGSALYASTADVAELVQKGRLSLQPVRDGRSFVNADAVHSDLHRMMTATTPLSERNPGNSKIAQQERLSEGSGI